MLNNNIKRERVRRGYGFPVTKNTKPARRFAFGTHIAAVQRVRTVDAGGGEVRRFEPPPKITGSVICDLE